MPRHQFEVDEDFEGDGSGGGNLVIRIVCLLRDLCQLIGYTVPELAKRRKVDERTIRRYLRWLTEARVLLLEEEDESGNKRWRIDPRDPLHKLPRALDKFGYFAIFFAAVQSSAIHAAAGISEVLYEFIDSYEKALGPKFRAYLLKLMLCIRPDNKRPYRNQPPPIYRELADAFVGDNICTVTYASARNGGKEQTYDILPLRMRPYDGATYVTHLSYLTNKLDMINLTRLRKFTVTDRVGVRPPEEEIDIFDDDPVGVIGHGPKVEYCLRFTPEWAVYARERRFHSTEVVRELKGGGLEVTFTAPESPELLSAVLRYREGVVALRPPSLRDAIVDTCEFLHLQYPKRSKPREGPPPKKIYEGRMKTAKRPPKKTSPPDGEPGGPA